MISTSTQLFALDMMTTPQESNPQNKRSRPTMPPLTVTLCDSLKRLWSVSVFLLDWLLCSCHVTGLMWVMEDLLNSIQQRTGRGKHYVLYSTWMSTAVSTAVLCHPLLVIYSTVPRSPQFGDLQRDNAKDSCSPATSVQQMLRLQNSFKPCNWGWHIRAHAIWKDIRINKNSTMVFIKGRLELLGKVQCGWLIAWAVTMCKIASSVITCVSVSVCACLSIVVRPYVGVRTFRFCEDVI